MPTDGMYKVAALYQFVSLPDFEALREPLRAICERMGIKGTLLLAHEGINGTVAGSPLAIDALVDELTHGQIFGARLDALELKFSAAAQMPFRRLKVRLKKEIVTLGHPDGDPTKQVGAYVAASEWNALLKTPGLVLLDTRNRFEVAMGTFEGAVDPGLDRFSAFRDYVERELDPAKHRKVALFCTGGIRCEKASAYMLARGFREVFHLKGGILKYLEEIPPERSLWRGACFVFDERVALEHGLTESPDAAAGSAQAHD